MNDLLELLVSIDSQSYQNIEIIVVVERSEIISTFVDRYNSKYKKRVYFTKEKLGVSKARNVGVDLSSGEIIAFVDDDAILSPEWSDRLVESLNSHPSAIGITGKAIPLVKSTNLRDFPQSLYWAIGCTRPEDSGQRYTNFASGVNMAFRRQAFDTHRFMLNIIGDSRSRALVYKGLPNDENDFAVRLTTDTGRPILYDSGLIVFHKVYPERTNLRFVKQYAFWQGFAEARYRSVSKWRSARLDTYRKMFSTIILDLFASTSDIRTRIRKTNSIMIAFLFLSLGFLAYNHPKIRYTVEKVL